jgi:hypothetical protein
MPFALQLPSHCVSPCATDTGVSSLSIFREFRSAEVIEKLDWQTDDRIL